MQFGRAASRNVSRRYVHVCKQRRTHGALLRTSVITTARLRNGAHVAPLAAHVQTLSPLQGAAQMPTTPGQPSELLKTTLLSPSVVFSQYLNRDTFFCLFCFCFSCKFACNFINQLFCILFSNLFFLIFNLYFVQF